MRLAGTALRLTIMVSESDRWHHRPLFTEIVHRAHRCTHNRIHEFLPQLDELVSGGLVLLDDCEVVLYEGAAPTGGSDDVSRRGQ